MTHKTNPSLVMSDGFVERLLMLEAGLPLPAIDALGALSWLLKRRIGLRSERQNALGGARTASSTAEVAAVAEQYIHAVVDVVRTAVMIGKVIGGGRNQKANDKKNKGTIVTAAVAAAALCLLVSLTAALPPWRLQPLWRILDVATVEVLLSQMHEY